MSELIFKFQQDTRCPLSPCMSGLRGRLLKRPCPTCCQCRQSQTKFAVDAVTLNDVARDSGANSRPAAAAVVVDNDITTSFVAGERESRE